MTSLDDVPPLDPDRDEAVDWLVRELSKPEYAAAQPTLLDRVAQAIRDWLGSLLVPGDGTLGAWIPLIAVLLVAAAVVAAVVIWGLPRRSRARPAAGTLFGDDDTRTARELREHARRAAERGDWDAAALDAFRALARGLAERTIVVVSPGTTAHGFAVRAEAAFPDERKALHRAASVFDRVRYLDEHATRDDVELIAAVDDRLANRRHDIGEPGAVHR